MLQFTAIEPKAKLEPTGNKYTQQVRNQILENFKEIEPHFLTVKPDLTRLIDAEEIDKIKLAIKFLKAAPSNPNLAYDGLTMQHTHRVHCKITKEAITAEIEDFCRYHNYIELAYCRKTGAILMQVKPSKF